MRKIDVCVCVCVCVCVAEMLEESPALLETEDVEDLLSLAQYYYSKTPLSLRKVGLKHQEADQFCTPNTHSNNKSQINQ